MSVTNFLQLPPAVRIAFVILIWPALWAGASFAWAFAGDVIRQRRKRDDERAPDVGRAFQARRDGPERAARRQP
jgi:hypothetical protein